MANYALECERITAAIFSTESRCVPPIMSLSELEDCNLDEAAHTRWYEIATHISALPKDILTELVTLTDEALLHMVEPLYEDAATINHTGSPL